MRSLVQVLDRTVSTGGARHLRAWLRHPSSDPTVVTARLGVVSALVACTDVRSALRERKGEARVRKFHEPKLKFHRHYLFLSMLK